VSTSRRSAEHEFIIVGGGLVGWSLAYGLAREGRRVMVLDEGDVALRAARGNFGQVWVQDKGPGRPGYQRITREAARQWKDLDQELSRATGISTGLAQPGGLSFCFDQPAYDARVRLMQRMQTEAGEFGFEFEMLRRDRLDRMVPGLGPRVVGASWTPYDGHVNPLRLYRALCQASLALGVRHQPGPAVETVAGSVSGFTVQAGRGRLQAEKVVLAAGLGNRALAPMLGLDCPVVPVRGHILVTGKVATLLRYPTADLRQTDDGGLLLGSSQEHVGLDDQVKLRTAGAIARRAIDTLPCIAGLQVVRSWAALRVMTPDGLPVYDRSTDCPGAYVISSHSGVTLAPFHVYTLASAIARDCLPPALLAEYGAQRFAQAAPSPGAVENGGRDVPQPA